jgi:thiol-disulfide isomerase/thioredoxin
MKNRIRISKSIFIIFVTLIFATCTSSPKTYTVEGVVPDESFNGQMVYMSNYENNETTDSTLVIDGKFTFIGSTDTAVIRRLDLNRLYANFILENGKIYVDIADPNSAKGTPLNDKLSAYQAEITIYREELSGRLSEIASLEDEIRRKRNDEIHNEFRANVAQVYQKYFNANKNNMVGAFVLWNWARSLHPDSLELLYAEAGETVRNFKVLQRIIDTNAKKKLTAEGMQFVDFTIENGNIDGSRVSLSDYVGKGKYVLVDFWASWCAPCIAEIPVLLETYNQYKGDKFEILGVAVWDNRDASLESIESHNKPWAQIVDTGAIPVDLYGIDGIPHVILFDPDGKIVARGLRGNHLREKVKSVMGR